MTMGAFVAETEKRELVVDLDQSDDVSRVGGKAWPLALAIAAGHRVPAAFVITAGAREAGREAIAAQVEAKLSALGDGTFAVRSSAVGEDGRLRSFAGQLQTCLSVKPEGVLDAIASCWSSANTLRALRYGGDLGAVAVIVQRMVPADAAGVAFSADPHTGERGVVIIEAVPSLGERLVSGTESPEAWRVSDSSERVRDHETIVLSEAQTQRIAALAREMEALFGAPQDVEWALHDGELFLLQSRPITALPAAPVPIPIENVEGGWDRDDHHGVLSPLGWAWFSAYPAGLGEVFKTCGAPLERMEATRIGGRLYLRMVMEGPESAELPPRWVLWLAARLMPGFRRANRTAQTFVDERQYMAPMHAWNEGGREDMRRAIETLFDAEPAKLDDTELLSRIDRALALCHDGLHKHAFLHGPSVFGIGRLLLFLEDELGWDGRRVFEMIAGHSSATTQFHGQLEAIVEKHAAELTALQELPRSWAAWHACCPALCEEVSAWLADNRLRVMHYDPKHPTLGERPEYVLSIVEGIAADLRAGTRAKAGGDADAVVAEALSQLDDDKAAELRQLVDDARKGYAVREENGADAVSRPAGLLRHFVLELGRRIEGAIGAREHAVYLYPEEHAPALRGEIEDIGALVERRRGEESWALANRGPKRFGPPKPPMPPPDVFPRGMSRLMRILKWLDEAEALPAASDDDTLHGVGIGARVVTGKARVVHRPEQMASVRHGEIVVCRITSPEWAVGLGRVAALVTEEGGLLSHPAIIAREFDVSAVLGTTDATTRIRTGDIITVDPHAATVSLNRAAAPSPR